MKMKTILVSLFLLSFGFLVGCENTAAGFDKDMQNNTKKIDKAINS